MPKRAKLTRGNRFAKKEDPTTVWRIDQPAELDHLPNHYYVTCEKPPHRTIMLSESALLDRRLFTHLPDAPETDPDGVAERSLPPFFRKGHA